MTSSELNPLKYAKALMQRQAHVTIQLRPIGQTKHSKQPVTNEVLLQLSRALRTTHLLNGLALKFHMTSRRANEEQSRKLQFALKQLQQHAYAHQHHLDQLAAEQKRAEQQAEAWRQHIMLTSI